MMNQPTAAPNPSKSAPNYAQFGIQIEERGNSTHVFKDGDHIGSFTIDLQHKKLEFHFPKNEIFTFFAYIASDLCSKRVQWINESLRNHSLDSVQAGVAFLGFAKFEELMAYELGGDFKGEHLH
jgi:hypothetical protein